MATGNRRGTGPVAATDGAIYVLAGWDLVSISSAGALNWRVKSDQNKSHRRHPDGVVVGVSSGAVIAVASDGAVIWKFTPAGGFSGSVAYSDEVVYAGSVGGGSMQSMCAAAIRFGT